MDLSQLASLLRENGDQVLNGLSKLSLSTKLLKDLNESFGLVVEEREALSSTFQVISTSNSKVELLLDLQFLHDFVQRIVGLKLIQDNSAICDLISLNKFKNLKLLELRKVPINQVVGLQALRNQLQYIICVRCLVNLKDLFISCGGDQSQAFIWSELKEAVLSYNQLETIDHSFEYVPWLQTLDISHNSIVNAQAIDCLPNLKHLNLGFNHLETVPIFKKELFRNLQILILKSNYIGDLTGLLYLDNLVTLDLSCNCLVDHQTLSPIAQLAALQWLNLEGNPLSFHPNHRNITAKYLHSNTATVKFVLDRVYLSKIEIKLIGTYYPSSKFSGQFRREHQTSISSNMSELTNSSDVTQVTQVPASELTRSFTQRSKKVRTAVISETDEKADVRDEQGEIVNSDMNKSVQSVGSLNIPNDHVETQKKIESLRDEYGEEWLKGQGGSIMQDILGIEKSESPRLSSTPYEQDFMIHAMEVFKKPIENVTNAITAIVADNADNADVVSELSANNTFVTASESFDDDTEESEFEKNASSGDGEDYDEEDEEERPFFAQIHRKDHEPEDIIIVLTNKYIKERDSLTAKTRAKWLLEIITSCEIISKDPAIVCLEFDTVRRNMQQREYFLEEQEAQKFHREISNIISAKPMSALNQTIYRCMKCSMQFSQDKNFDFKDADNPNNLPICPIPNCRSTIVYELDEESTPTNPSILTQNNGYKSIDRPESPSECSIASETECNPVAQIHVIAEVHTNSNKYCNKATAVTANRSATSVQESSTSSHISADDNQISENNFKKYESDIEVISNPSQSSIEVLDDNMRNRKRSSEERRTMIAPTLGTISDVSINAPLQGLTESSSSSSFTESVCTAYDTTHPHVSRPSSGLEMKHPIQEESSLLSSTKTDKTNIITSLFEGLFSGPTVGTKSEKTTSNQNDRSIKFDYNENFSNIDHRIKYHLYENIFEDEHEHFVWLLKSILVSVNNQPVDGCIVLSTHKLYILHFKDNKSSDELSAWLVKKESFTIDRLETIYTLPWKQGVGLKIRGAAKKTQDHLCLLQDMQRTSNFLAFLADNPLPDTCDLVCVSPERPMLNLQQLLISQYTNATPKDSTLCLLSVFNKCAIINNEPLKLDLGVFLVTKTDLILLNDVFWLLPDAEKEPNIYVSQPISNLLEVDIENMSLDFHFLDEIAGCEEVWSIVFETIESLNTAISAVKTPWEEIFLVPLQVNHKVHSV